HPKADVPFLEGGQSGAALGGSTVAAGVAPAAAALDTIISLIRTGRVLYRPGGVGAVIVLAPLVEVAVNVEQAEWIGRVGADLGSSQQVRAGGSAAKGLFAVEVRLLGAQAVPEGEDRGRPRPAGVFPLGLGRQAVNPAGVTLADKVGEFFAEFDSVVPGHGI